jgi:hypothetical protein
MNKDGPNGSPYEALAKYDQSETKRDIEGVEGVLFIVASDPGGILLREVVQWLGESGKASDECAVKVTKTQK